MCSITFLPGPARDEAVLLMNRDEQRTRSQALPPQSFKFRGCRAIYPREPSGGTWIAATESQQIFALMNWSVRPPSATAASRGRLIPLLLEATAETPLHDVLQPEILRQTNPFRLFKISAPSHLIEEFQWDSLQIGRVTHPWQLSHWFSSGFDEPAVVASRQETAAAARKEPDFGTRAWARRLHASHQPTKSAYSICMHRADAKTVSLTEIHIRSAQVGMLYHPNPACQRTRSANCVFAGTRAWQSA